jgi:DNA-binding transcriptional LysR family regulator
MEPDLTQTALFLDRPVVVGRLGHPLAGSDPSLADLAAYPWIIAASGAPLRDAWEQMFERGGIGQPQILVESGSVMTIRNLLIDSDCLTLLSPDQVSVELEAKWLTTIAPAPEGACAHHRGDDARKLGADLCSGRLSGRAGGGVAG